MNEMATATQLEQFVTSVQTLSSQGNFVELCDVLNKSTDVLTKNVQHLDNVLDTLDTAQHSLGVLAVLYVKLNAQQQSPAPSAPSPDAAVPPAAGAAAPVLAEGLITDSLLFCQIENFINNCNGEQVRMAPETFTDMCHLITRSLTQMRCPQRGIDVLRRAIRKIQEHDSQLTSAHADLMQLCLLSKNFKPALEFLDTDISSITEEAAQGEAKYFLLYYYYGSMIYTALKMYDNALYFLEVVVTTPAMAVSHIMIAAYKKYILVSLILHGKVINPPKFTSNVVERFIKPLSKHYHELDLACESNSCEDVQACLQANADTFSRDGNAGLAKQVLASLRKKNIQRLTKTFLTLSLSDVASRVQLSSPKDAERAILNMIEDGEIFASINQKDGMVFFHDDPEKYNTPAALRHLEEEMARCAELDRKILEMDEKIVVNPQFVKKQQCGATEDDMTLAPSLSAQGTSSFTM